MDEGFTRRNVSFSRVTQFLLAAAAFFVALIAGVIITMVLRKIFKSAAIWVKLILIVAVFLSPHYLYPYISKTYHVADLFYYNMLAYASAGGFSVGLFIEPFRQM